MCHLGLLPLMYSKGECYEVAEQRRDEVMCSEIAGVMYLGCLGMRWCRWVDEVAVGSWDEVM